MTPQEAMLNAQEAGFNGQSASTIVAIAQAESGLNPNARGINTSGSVDRGILQINNVYHPEVSDYCAYNPQCAFQQAYRISNAGTNFTPWTTYNSGAYRQYLSKASFTTNTSPNSSSGITGTWQDQVMVMAEKIAVFIMAILLIFLGFYILNQKAISSAIGKGKQAVELAAVA